MTSQQHKGGQAAAQTGYGSVSAAEVEKFVKGIDFPCDREGVKQCAQENDAPQEVLDLISQTPDREYSSAADLAVGIGEAKRH